VDTLITVNERGALTLPKEIRRQAGIPHGGPVRIQMTSEGVLITPVVAYPIENYTPERLAEFRLNNALDADDYRAALKEVRQMGLDPAAIPHEPVKEHGR
jgi:bifunctional DNA-binding transcriptional regulator/antitoxin component of YhaV-PrlF toxin-antitoxin module